MVNPEDRYVAKKKGESFCFSFETDGIFVGANQDEFYYYGMRDIVDNAMQGVSSVVVSLGAESSGKSFTLFGSDNFQVTQVVQRLRSLIIEINSYFPQFIAKRDNPSNRGGHLLQTGVQEQEGLPRNSEHVLHPKRQNPGLGNVDPE